MESKVSLPSSLFKFYSKHYEMVSFLITHFYIFAFSKDLALWNESNLGFFKNSTRKGKSYSVDMDADNKIILSETVICFRPFVLNFKRKMEEKGEIACHKHFFFSFPILS